MGVCTSLSYCLARHSGDNLSVQLSEVSSLTGFNTSLNFHLAISPRLVYNVCEGPSIVLGSFSIFACTGFMIRMFIFPRAGKLGESSEYVSIVSGNTPWLSYRIVTIASKSQGTPVELNLLKLKLSKELLHYMISPVVAS